MIMEILNFIMTIVGYMVRFLESIPFRAFLIGFGSGFFAYYIKEDVKQHREDLAKFRENNEKRNKKKE